MNRLLLLGLMLLLLVGFQNCGNLRSGQPLVPGNGIMSPGNEPAPTQDGTSTGNPPQTGITFAKLSATIFQPKCVECHKAGEAEGGVRYDTYQQTLQKGHLDSLYQHYSVGKEPAPECTKISNAEMAQVLSWIDSGTPE